MYDLLRTSCAVQISVTLLEGAGGDGATFFLGGDLVGASFAGGDLAGASFFAGVLFGVTAGAAPGFTPPPPSLNMLPIPPNGGGALLSLSVALAPGRSLVFPAAVFPAFAGVFEATLEVPAFGGATFGGAAVFGVTLVTIFGVGLGGELDGALAFAEGFSGVVGSGVDFLDPELGNTGPAGAFADLEGALLSPCVLLTCTEGFFEGVVFGNVRGVEDAAATARAPGTEVVAAFASGLRFVFLGLIASGVI